MYECILGWPLYWSFLKKILTILVKDLIKLYNEENPIKTSSHVSLTH